MIRVETGLALTDIPILLWRNVVTPTNVSAEEETGFPASNVANPATALKWKHETSDSPVSTIELFRIDTSQTNPINYVAIVGHNFAEAGIAIGLELASDGSPFFDAEIVFDDQIPSDNGPLVFLFTTREVEDVRIRFTTTATAAEMAVVYCGQYTVMDEGIQGSYVPLPMARVPDVVSGRSENGAFLGRIVTGEGLASTAVIANMEDTFVLDDLIPFLEFAIDNPFFWLWSPNSYRDENGAAYAWLVADAQPSLDIDGYWAVTLDMRGIGAT